MQHECAHEHVADVIRPDEHIATDPWPNGDLLKTYVKDWIRGRAAKPGPFYAQIGTFDAHLGRFFTNRPPRPDEHYPPVRMIMGFAYRQLFSGSQAARPTGYRAGRHRDCAMSPIPPSGQ